jgi:hypothetical protein
LQRVTLREIDTLFANPGQGWMSQNLHPTGKPRFPCSVCYLRFDWAEVEPEEGRYDWHLIDDVIAAWKPYNAAVAMRVMTANAHSAGYYSSPRWLFDRGCRGFEYESGGDDPTTGGKRIKRIEPDYADPLYLNKHGAFLDALGKRYDGSPSVEFLDIGSYGIWGEWHTPHPAPVAVRRQIVDRYLSAFPKTPLVFMSDDVEVIGYALERGAGLRRDGVGSPWHEQNWIGSPRYASVRGMGETWKKAPIVFEWYGDYDYLKSKGWSFDAAVNFMLTNHVTMINDNVGDFPPEALPQLETLARRAGYRFVLREVLHESVVKPGATLNLKMHWANVGVGKLYHPYELRLSLHGMTDPSAAVTDATGSGPPPRDWLPGEQDITAVLRVPSRLRPGDYLLSVALLDPSRPRRHLNLAIDAPEEKGWYQVSRVKIG